MNKKGVIAEGIIWFVSLFVIVILLVLLFTSSVYLAGKKKIPIFGEGDSEISFEENVYSVGLSEILNSQIKIGEKSISLEELILNWNFGKEEDWKFLEEEGKKILTDFEFEYTNSNTENLRRRSFALKIYKENELNSKEIFSENFNSGFCVGVPCKNLFVYPILISSSEKINVALLASQEAVKNEK